MKGNLLYFAKLQLFSYFLGISFLSEVLNCLYYMQLFNSFNLICAPIFGVKYFVSKLRKLTWLHTLTELYYSSMTTSYPGSLFGEAKSWARGWKISSPWKQNKGPVGRSCANPRLKLNLLFKFLYFYTSVSFKTSQTKPTISEVKICEKDNKLLMDHSPIRQTFKLENNFSTVGKSFLNLVKL